MKRSRMIHKSWSGILAFGVVAVIFLAVFPARPVSASPLQYSVMGLGSLGSNPAWGSGAVAVNNSGQIAGGGPVAVSPPAGTAAHGFLYSNGTMDRKRG